MTAAEGESYLQRLRLQGNQDHVIRIGRRRQLHAKQRVLESDRAGLLRVTPLIGLEDLSRKMSRGTWAMPCGSVVSPELVHMFVVPQTIHSTRRVAYGFPSTSMR